MLSTTTTALSTSMPTASSRPIIEMMLSEMPVKYMKPRVMTKQIGIAVLTMSVDGQWRRNAYSTITDSSRPMPPASASASSELVTAGLNDPRVTYWEPAKWVAKLRELKTDDNELLFKTNMGAGHGGKSGRFESLKETAEEFAFILWQLGVEG